MPFTSVPKKRTSATLGVNCGMSTGCSGIVLNDQGGGRMDVTEEVTSTLRAEAHHPPCVMESAGFCTEHSAKTHDYGMINGIINNGSKEEPNPVKQAEEIKSKKPSVLAKLRKYQAEDREKTTQHRSAERDL